MVCLSNIGVSYLNCGMLFNTVVTVKIGTLGVGYAKLQYACLLAYAGLKRGMLER